MNTNNLLSLLFPKEIVEYFEVVKSEEKNGELHIHLEEHNSPPKGNLESKGFYPVKEIQDFPLRGKPVFLKVKRRRWRDKETGDEVKKEFKLTSQGTKYTQEFAAFLKELARI